MQTRQMNVLEYLNEKPKIIIEEFQRSYEWNRTNVQKFLQTIIKVGLNENVTSKHLAHIYHQNRYSSNGLEQMKILVDGQQRITTLVLIIIRIAEYLNEKDVVSIPYTSEELLNNFVINVYPNNDIKLVLHDDDFKSLTKIVNSVKSNEKVMFTKDSNLEEIYKYLQKLLNSDELMIPLFNGLKKLRFTVEELSENENIYDTYVELNSTSKPLSKQDQLKGFLFMSNFTENNDELYLKYYVPLNKNLQKLNIAIDTFFRGVVYILTESPYVKIWGVKNNIISIIDVIEYYITNDTFSLEELCKLCLELSDTIVEFTENSKLKNSMRIFKKFSYQPVALFLRLAFLYNNDRINLNDVNDTLNIMEPILVRGKIAGVKFIEVPNWTKFCKDVDFSDINSLKYNLRMWNSKRKIFVTDTEIHNIFQTKSVSPKLIKFILLELNNYIEDEKVSLFNEDNVQIEHILPKKLEINPLDLGFVDKSDYDMNNGKLGNLTLLTQRKNVKASNNTFDLKKEIYKDAPFKITNQLCNFSRFTKIELINNTETYADLFCKRWKNYQ